MLVSVLYFVVCFAKSFAKYPGNVKYETFIVGLREIEVETGIPPSTVHSILTEHLFKEKVAVWWKPQALTGTQKQTRLKIAQEHLKWFRRKRENLLNRIIAIDKMWIWDFELELKSEGNLWKSRTSLQPKKNCHLQSKVKQMIFMCNKDCIVTNRVPNGITVTAAYYQKFIRSVFHP